MPDEHIAPQRVPNSPPPPDERIAARPGGINLSSGGGLWSLLLKGKEIGPFTVEELTAKIGDGSLHPEDHVRTEHGTWAPAGSFPALARRLADHGSAKSQLHGDRKRAASGIWGGWLVLPTVFLILSPLHIQYGIIMEVGRVERLRGDSMLNLGMLLFWILVASAFFRQKRQAPALVILFLLAGILVSPVEAWAVYRPVDFSQILVRAVIAAIWIPYFVLSRRVEATFVR
jgi:hypothetical protein